MTDAHSSLNRRLKPVGDLEKLVASARRLAQAVAQLEFGPPVACVYNPLVYAWKAHEAYLRSFGTPPKRVVFVGMNPGPFGMVQTGVPFGEVTIVRDWLGLRCAVGRPEREHPRRPVQGLACPRSEVSGQRLWGLFALRFGTTEKFFREHMVLNYCPLAFVESSGRNLTPDRLPASETSLLFSACDAHLRLSISVLRPEWLIAVGDFALGRVQKIFPEGTPKLGRILHPSPASPAANRNWAAVATHQLQELGVWPSR